jgi:molybdopterin-binding protein
VAEAEVERLLAHRHPGRPAPRRTATPQAWIVALSGRNRLHGFVEEVRVDGLLAQVRLRIGDQRLTAVITRDAVDELKLKRGEDAVAIIKATEVMIAREVPAGGADTLRRRGQRR